MKKIITFFVLSSLLKAFSLYLIILLGNVFSESLLILRYLLYIFILCFIDWKVFTIISNAIEKWKWIALTTFSFGTFIVVLYITGPIFRIHNKIFEIQPKESANAPSVIPFLIFGFALAAIITTIWTKKRLKTNANSC